MVLQANHNNLSDFNVSELHDSGHALNISVHLLINIPFKEELIRVGCPRAHFPNCTCKFSSIRATSKANSIR